LRLHLNNDQIDELLQEANPNELDESVHREYLEDARSHLKICESCQARVRAHERAMESLTFLKPTTPGVKGPMCPSDDVWLNIAAGIVGEESENQLSHAAKCDYCGPLLRQAKEDFADGLSLEEEANFADLSSGTRAWQQRLAARLQGGQSLALTLSPPKHPWPWLLTSSLPWRTAFAGVLIALILLGVRDYRRVVSLSARDLQATAEIHHLEQSVLRQNARIAELNAELRRSGTAAPTPGNLPTGNVLLASLVPDPTTRGAIAQTTVPKRLTLPRARIELRLLDIPEGVVRANLVTRGQIKWSQELQPSKTEQKTNSLSLSLPDYLLTPDDYQIVLGRDSLDGFERFATYSFRIVR
jgi:hypothetical protein